MAFGVDFFFCFGADFFEAVEDFLYHEAAVLDAWDLDGWLGLLCDDARYLIPPNDVPDGDPDTTLFIIADDIDRIRGRVKRLKSRDAHAEFPPSRTRRLITNVRILEQDATEVTVTANFSVHRFRRGGNATHWPCLGGTVEYCRGGGGYAGDGGAAAPVSECLVGIRRTTVLCV